MTLDEVKAMAAAIAAASRHPDPQSFAEDVAANYIPPAPPAPPEPLL